MYLITCDSLLADLLSLSNSSFYRYHLLASDRRKTKKGGEERKKTKGQKGK